MEFYNYSESDFLKNKTEVKSSGIDMEFFAKALKDIEKNSQLKTMNEIEAYDLVILSDLTFLKDFDSIVYISNMKVKKNALSRDRTFALVKKNEVFGFEINGVDGLGKITQGKLFIGRNEKELENNIPELNPKLTETEKKAFDWLETGETGASSCTMCKALFPNLLFHERLSKREDIDFPYDNSDFRRCLNFVNTVGVKDRLNEIKSLSPEWKKIIGKWDEIENNLEINPEKSYDILKECTNRNTKKSSKISSTL